MWEGEEKVWRVCLFVCVFVYWSEVYVGCLLHLLFTLVLEIASLTETEVH